MTLPRARRCPTAARSRCACSGRVDIEAFLAFTQSLGDHDLLFLRTDITDAGVVADWLDNIEAGRIVTIVAERDGAIFGYGSLHLSNAPWSQHVGELRVLISDEMRGKGLGRALTDAIFAQALDRGIEKMVAQMTIDQKGAIATFEELGFKAEALLPRPREGPQRREARPARLLARRRTSSSRRWTPSASAKPRRGCSASRYEIIKSARGVPIPPARQREEGDRPSSASLFALVWRQLLNCELAHHALECMWLSLRIRCASSRKQRST